MRKYILKHKKGIHVSDQQYYTIIFRMRKSRFTLEFFPFYSGMPLIFTDFQQIHMAKTHFLTGVIINRENTIHTRVFHIRLVELVELGEFN